MSNIQQAFSSHLHSVSKEKLKEDFLLPVVRQLFVLLFPLIQKQKRKKKERKRKKKERKKKEKEKKKKRKKESILRVSCQYFAKKARDGLQKFGIDSGRAVQ